MFHVFVKECFGSNIKKTTEQPTEHEIDVDKLV